MSNNLIYLSSPYTHKSEDVEQERFEQALLAAGYLINSLELVFSPIAHSHPIAKACKLSGSYDYWIRLNQAWIRACARLYLLQIPGWKESIGVRAEFDYAQALKTPVFLMVPIDNEYEIIPVTGDLWT